MGFFSGGFGSLLGAGASLFGGIMGNNASADQANDAMAFSEHQYNTRYQNTVKDLEAAGLNPMLAYSNGPGSPPSGTAMQMQNPATGISAAAEAGANIHKTLADADVSTAMAAKLAGDIPQADIKKKVFNKIDELISSGFTSSSAKHGERSLNASDAMRELYPDIPDERSPFHKVIDSIGEFNPYGLSNSPFGF